MVQKRSEDLRIQRTHRLLLSALVDLLSEKSFSDLRVKDICERAGVHRSTFYTHFEDKSHLLLFGIQELMDDLIHSGDDRSYPAFLHSVYRILKYFQRNQQEYTRLLLDPKDALVQRLFHDEFSRALKSYLRDLHPTMPAREIDIISQFFAGLPVSRHPMALGVPRPLRQGDGRGARPPHLPGLPPAQAKRQSLTSPPCPLGSGRFFLPCCATFFKIVSLTRHSPHFCSLRAPAGWSTLNTETSPFSWVILDRFHKKLSK